jgi:hypothetical protein
MGASVAGNKGKSKAKAKQRDAMLMVHYWLRNNEVIGSWACSRSIFYLEETWIRSAFRFPLPRPSPPSGERVSIHGLEGIGIGMPWVMALMGCLEPRNASLISPPPRLIEKSNALTDFVKSSLIRSWIS